MSRDNNHQNGNDRDQQLQIPIKRSTFEMSHGNHSHSKQRQLSRENPICAQHPWKYTNLDNVKVLYNPEDARRYVKSMAETLEITHYDDSSKFIQAMLQRVDHVTKPKDGPFEYWHNGSHEQRYILVLIENRGDRIDIGYSYHSMTDELPSTSNSTQNAIRPEAKTLDWFRGKARECLRIPANIVGNMISNEQSIEAYQTQQVSQRQEQKPMETIHYNKQERDATNHPSPLPFNEADHLMDHQSASSGRTTKR